MSENKENMQQIVRKVKVDVKVEPFEEVNTENNPKVNDQPYVYDPIKKQIICSKGTIFVDMKELKDEINQDEERMRTVDRGISRVSFKIYKSPFCSLDSSLYPLSSLAHILLLFKEFIQ